MKDFCFILLFMIMVLNTGELQAQENQASRKAPDFTLESIDGGTISLKQLVSKGPVLLCFWATWCKPCQDELIEYQYIYNLFKENNYTMLGVSIDNEKTVSKVKPFIKTKKHTFPVVLDPNSDVARKYFVTDVPTSVLIDRTGKIVYNHRGFAKGDEIILKQKIQDLLKK